MKRAAVLAAVALLVLVAWWLLRDTSPPRTSSAPPRTAAQDPPAPSLPAAEGEPQPLGLPEAESSDTPPSWIPAMRAHLSRQTQDGWLGLEEDGLHLSGRVVTASGRPVAEARVLLIQDLWGIEGDYGEWEQDSALTDGDGRFRVHRDSHQDVEELRVIVRAEGFPPWFGRVEPLGDGSDVVLGDCDWLTLSVRFDDGEPMADALVQYENPGRERQLDVDAVTQQATTVGRTDRSGRLRLPIFRSRRQLWLVLEHEFHLGRHDVPIAAWRAGGPDFEWTLTVPRGSACELQLLGWPGGWTGSNVWPNLQLRPYVRHGDALELAQHLDWDVMTHALQAGVQDGGARITALRSPAYRVEFSDGTEAGTEVLADPWVPPPGLTVWTRATPPVPPEWYEPLCVEVVVEEQPSLWQGIEWHLRAEDAHGHVEERRLEHPGAPVTFSARFEERVSLRVAELGDLGLRSDVPPEGLYRFEVAAEAVRQVTGGVRVDFGAIVPPPRDVRFVVAAPGNRDVRGVDGSEARGLPAGTWRVYIPVNGISPKVQTIDVLAGQVAEVHALPAPAPTQGLLRGRLRLPVDDPSIRLTEVHLDGRETSGSGADALGARSFSLLLDAGHYSGHVTVGRAHLAAEYIGNWPDPGMIRHEALNALPLVGPFEADVRAGGVTDIVIDMVEGAAEPAAPR